MATFLLISIPACLALSWEASVSLSTAERGDWVLMITAIRGQVAVALVVVVQNQGAPSSRDLSPQPVGPMGPNRGKLAHQASFIAPPAPHPT